MLSLGAAELELVRSSRANMKVPRLATVASKVSALGVPVSRRLCKTPSDRSPPDMQQRGRFATASFIFRVERCDILSVLEIA